MFQLKPWSSRERLQRLANTHVDGPEFELELIAPRLARSLALNAIADGHRQA